MLRQDPCRSAVQPIQMPPRMQGAIWQIFRLALVAAADIEIEVFVLVFVFFEEGVGVVVAKVFHILDVLDIGDFVFFAGLFGIGFLEGDDLGSGGIGLFHFLDFFLFVIVVGRGPFGGGLGANGARLLEIGARVGLAGIGRDDRILVQIVELLAGLGVFALCAAVIFGQCSYLFVNRGGSRFASPVRVKVLVCQTQNAANWGHIGALTGKGKTGPPQGRHAKASGTSAPPVCKAAGTGSAPMSSAPASSAPSSLHSAALPP